MRQGLIVLLLLNWMLHNVCCAQGGILKSEVENLETEAWEAFNNKNYKEAIRLFAKDLNGPRENDALKGLALSHFHTEEYNIAAQYFKRLDVLGKLGKTDFLNYARSLIFMREYIGLNTLKDKFEKEYPEWFEESEFRSLLKFIELRQPFYIAKNSRIKVTPFTEVNSYNSEYAPVLHNGKLYIVSDRKFNESSKANEPGSYMLLRATEDGENLQQEIMDNKHHYGPVSFSEKFMFYSATNKLKRNDEKAFTPEGVTLYPAIYYKRIGKKDKEEKPLIPDSFNQYAMLDPFWNEKSQAILYASDMPAGYGGLDLYYQQLHPDGSWSIPINLGPEVNTEGNERSPYVIDSLLYFSSDGHIGFGRLDIFKAVKLDSGYSTPENLGFGVNSSQDDFSFMLDPSNSNLGLFATNRVGGRGSEDIYKVDFTDSRSARLVIQAIDWETKQQVDFFDIKILNKKGTRVNFERYRTGASYNLEVFQQGEFVLQLEAQGYMPVTNINVSLNSFSEADSLKLTLFPLEKGRAITLFQDGFEDDLEINNLGKARLNEFYSKVKHLSYLSITVIAHTDSRGSEDTKAEISRKKAEAVREYLGIQGLDVRFINVLGRGDKDLLNPCQIESQCSEEEHAQNRRIEIRFDDFFVG